VTAVGGGIDCELVVAAFFGEHGMMIRIMVVDCCTRGILVVAVLVVVQSQS